MAALSAVAPFEFLLLGHRCWSYDSPAAASMCEPHRLQACVVCIRPRSIAFIASLFDHTMCTELAVDEAFRDALTPWMGISMFSSAEWTFAC